MRYFLFSFIGMFISFYFQIGQAMEGEPPDWLIEAEKDFQAGNLSKVKEDLDPYFNHGKHGVLVRTYLTASEYDLGLPPHFGVIEAITEGGVDTKPLWQQALYYGLALKDKGEVKETKDKGLQSLEKLSEKGNGYASYILDLYYSQKAEKYSKEAIRSGFKVANEQDEVLGLFGGSSNSFTYEGKEEGNMDKISSLISISSSLSGSREKEESAIKFKKSTILTRDVFKSLSRQLTPQDYELSKKYTERLQRDPENYGVWVELSKFLGALDENNYSKKTLEENEQIKVACLENAKELGEVEDLLKFIEELLKVGMVRRARKSCEEDIRWQRWKKDAEVLKKIIDKFKEAKWGWRSVYKDEFKKKELLEALEKYEQLREGLISWMSKERKAEGDNCPAKKQELERLKEIEERLFREDKKYLPMCDLVMEINYSRGIEGFKILGSFYERRINEIKEKQEQRLNKSDNLKILKYITKVIECFESYSKKHDIASIDFQEINNKIKNLKKEKRELLDKIEGDFDEYKLLLKGHEEWKIGKIRETIDDKKAEELLKNSHLGFFKKTAGKYYKLMKGLLFLIGWNGIKNPQETAKEYFREAAKEEKFNPRFYLTYFDSPKQEKDISKKIFDNAITRIKKGEKKKKEMTEDLQKKIAEAKFDLSLLFLEGKAGLPEDERIAEELLQEVENTSPDELTVAKAQFNLGIIKSDKGYAGEEDKKKTLEYWFKSAERNFAKAKLYLGVLYWLGDEYCIKKTLSKEENSEKKGLQLICDSANALLPHYRGCIFASIIYYRGLNDGRVNLNKALKCVNKALKLDSRVRIEAYLLRVAIFATKRKSQILKTSIITIIPLIFGVVAQRVGLGKLDQYDKIKFW